MPSGVSLPLFLKRKWGKEQRQKKQAQRGEPSTTDNGDGEKQTLGENEDDGNTTARNEESPSETWEPQLRLRLDQELTRDETNELSNRVFTTAELEERIMKTTSAMFDIQRQLHRGEEIYYEDTYNHGSIYKGWDAFVDMKDIGTTSSTGGGANQTSSNRRVPVDSRWFSTSCGSVSRTEPPASFPPPLITQESLATAKLPTIPEQQEQQQASLADSKATTIRAHPPPGTTTIVKAVAPLPDSPTSIGVNKVKKKAETEIEIEPSHSSSRTSQRATSSTATATTASSSIKSAEKADKDGASATPKPSSRFQNTGTKTDPGSTRKKRKSTTTTSSEEPTSKRANQKTSSEEGRGGLKNAGSAIGSLPKPATTVTTRGSKSESNTSATKSEKNQGTSSVADKTSSKADSEAPTKRQKEVDAPVPRKRGRPRRKS
eukprot:jgi/Psemu1/282669/fgenesh1_pg.11_\